jgi:hypothetical protein
MVHTRCTYMDAMEFEHQRREDERWAGKQCKGGKDLFQGNASPTVPGVFKSEDQKQAPLLYTCPRLLQEKVCMKRWAESR